MQPGFRLPPAEPRAFGRSATAAPSVIPIDGAIALVDEHEIGVWSPDLQCSRWTRSVAGWGGLYAANGWICHSVDHSLRRFGAADGAAVGGPVAYDGWVKAIWHGGCLAGTKEALTAYDWSGRCLWRHPGFIASCVIYGNALLMHEVLGTRVVCVDLESGAVRWIFEIPPGANARDSELAAGQPSLVVVESQRVLAVTVDRRVFSLRLATGELLGWARPPLAGWFQIDDDVIYFQQPFGISEFDHSELRERRRIDYEEDVRPLYGSNPVSSNGFYLTSESVVWTTMHGELMAVSLTRNETGRRRTWRYLVPGINPLGKAPLVFGNYLYHRAQGDPPSLLCFRGAEP